MSSIVPLRTREDIMKDIYTIASIHVGENASEIDKLGVFFNEIKKIYCLFKDEYSRSDSMELI
ncbi:MAG: hypothetical protein JXA94_00460 [Parachlamydiales bacterium]|nr:hypothetical protein [Parachlamydiales bacterium]